MSSSRVEDFHFIIEPPNDSNCQADRRRFRNFVCCSCQFCKWIKVVFNILKLREFARIVEIQASRLKMCKFSELSLILLVYEMEVEKYLKRKKNMKVWKNKCERDIELELALSGILPISAPKAPPTSAQWNFNFFSLYHCGNYTPIIVGPNY